MAGMTPSVFRRFFIGILIGTGAFATSGCFRNVSAVDTSDAGITARFKEELKKHQEIEVQYLDVDTHAGILTLSGIVSSDNVRYEIVHIARGLKGVTQVIANLVVR